MWWDVRQACSRKGTGGENNWIRRRQTEIQRARETDKRGKGEGEGERVDGVVKSLRKFKKKFVEQVGE